MSRVQGTDVFLERPHFGVLSKATPPTAQDSAALYMQPLPHVMTVVNLNWWQRERAPDPRTKSLLAVTTSVCHYLSTTETRKLAG